VLNVSKKKVKWHHHQGGGFIIQELTE